MKILYIRPTCPYCIKVLNFAQENNIKLDTKDIANHEVLEELINIGGKSQVPFLYADNGEVKMYESDDIIEYLSGGKCGESSIINPELCKIQL